MNETSPLRKKLLDLAISGKLVPKTGEWKTVKLGEIAEVQLGKMLDRGKNIGTPYKYLANVNVRWGTFDLSNLKETLFTQGDVEKFKLIPGDLLMCEGGVPGRCAIWREENSSIKYQKAVHRIRPSASVTAEYLQIYFESIHDKLSFVRKFTGSTIHHLPREVLILEPIPLPPLAEQKAIVKRLEELLALEREIAADSAALDDLITAAKRKILDLAVSGKLVPKMGAWKKIRLGDLVNLISGTSYEKGDVESTGIRVLRGGNVHADNTISRKEDDVFLPTSYVDVEKSPLKTDIVIVASTGSVTVIGRPGIPTEDMKDCQIGAFLRIVRPKDAGLSPFLGVIFRSDSYKRYIEDLAKGTNIKNIKACYINDFEFSLPPLAEQKAIVKRVEELFAVLDAMKEV